MLEASSERATLYRPLPPDVLMDEQERSHRRIVAELREGLAALYENQDEERVWSISGRSSVLSYAGQMIRQAQEELYLVLDDPDLLALKADVAAACQRGVAAGIVLTGEGDLACGQVVRHPPLESELHDLQGALIVVADRQEALVASCGTLPGGATGGYDLDMAATITQNHNLVLIARQFIWMELFAQRVFATLGSDLLARLEPEDRRIFESLEPWEA